MLKDFIAFQIAKEIYRECKGIKLPPHLSDQLMRASSSIALNIAEGSGKRTSRDQAKFYSIALGSLRESQAILEIEDIEHNNLKDKMNSLGGILFKLSKKGK